MSKDSLTSTHSFKGLKPKPTSLPLPETDAKHSLETLSKAPGVTTNNYLTLQRSRTVTFCPFFASWYAIEQPTIPPPNTTTRLAVHMHNNERTLLGRSVVHSQQLVS